MSKLLLRTFVFAALFLPCLAVDTLTIFVKGRSPALDSARSEVARLMEPAGFSVDWKDISERRTGDDFARLVIVELKGNCSAGSAGASGSVDIRSLASTAIVDGKVLPFSTVECDSLRKLMASSQPGLKVFGRAMGRVIAHELYHMLVQTKTHSTAGVSKSCFSAADLLAERFDFDGVSLATFRPVEADEAFPVEEAGR